MDMFEKLTAKPHLKGPKQQHYVPNFYLKGFTSDGVLAVFDRFRGEVRRRQQPQKVATVRHLYTFEDKQDRKRFDLEVLFGHIEDAAAPIITSLANGGRLSAADRESFALFLGLAAVRTPAAIADARNVFGGLEKARSQLLLADENAVFRLLKKMPDADEDDSVLRKEAQDIAKMAREGSFDVEVDPQYALHKSLGVWHIVAEELFKRDWMVLHTTGDDHSFLTSDSPIVLTSLSQSNRNQPLGYGSPEAQILFPLTSKCALVASGYLGRTGRSDITVDNLRRFNMTIASDCQRYVMGGDATLVESITNELRLAESEWQPKSTVEVGYRMNADGTLARGALVKRQGA
ncbi:DUF4238 domain-containing protein [Pseudomonas alloputida]|uniref:DUF4238 domain-containing protein n=1 Tax=Pseudomonas alloputida TaxID=1940621 RepID=UPI001E37AAEA|nr:DUF4238 domain-containing protein [Pseudomonas alloputida]MCE0904728.1 DUF4238 domain-containing protein [Pseudomonas alloputida]